MHLTLSDAPTAPLFPPVPAMPTPTEHANTGVTALLTSLCPQHTSAYVSIRQHKSAYVSIRQHTSAYVSIRQHTNRMAMRSSAVAEALKLLVYAALSY